MRRWTNVGRYRSGNNKMRKQETPRVTADWSGDLNSDPLII